jgi:hypothetical protein
MNRRSVRRASEEEGRWVAFTLTCLAALTGCAGPAPLRLRQPVGPEIEQVDAAATRGDLLVYSADRVSMTVQSEYPVHTAYTIYSLDGRAIKRVRNLAGTFNQDPEKVSLPQGSYRIKALKSGGGEVIVTVVIRPGKITVVDLDGTALPQGKNAQGQWVRAPDGHVVGWQADCTVSRCR